MKKVTSLFAILAIALVSFRTHRANTWSFDGAHSNLHWSVDFTKISDIEGSFRIKEASIASSNDDFDDAKVTLVADVKSINTDNEKRDEHLKTADFFDAEKYPDITFTSTSFKKNGDNKYKLTGDLTFHGVTKSVTMNAVSAMSTNPRDNKTVAGFRVSGVVKRSEFGIAPKMDMLGDDVMIRANLRFKTGGDK